MIPSIFRIALLSLLIGFSTSAQKPLPRSLPEKEGVSAAAISRFVDAASHSRTEFHSFMFLRHGKVVAEGWWDPYAPGLKHTLYSTSKSFTAAAVGFAITEGRLRLTDKVTAFFPNDLPDPVPPFLAELTVKDALMMSDGQEPDPTPAVVIDTNWARKFLSIPILHEPGTKFLYNSTGTYMLAAIVQKVTGQTVLDYLKPRLFEPLGITGEDWETSPQGVNTGGWGLRLKTEDMAKFGQLYLQGGNWNGKQILPQSWVKEATSMKIMQDPDAPQSKKDSSDWLQGYCYQMWRCRHNGVRADGAFGQFIIMLPDEDAVIAITAETADMQDEINLVWQYLLPSMHLGTLPADPEADARLKKQLAALALPPLAVTAPPAAGLYTGKTFTFEPNPKKIQSITFNFIGDICQLTLKGDTAVYRLTYGNGRWATGWTTRPGPNLLTGAVHHDVGLPAFPTVGSYQYLDDHTLKLLLRYTESPHSETMICHLDGNKLTIEDQNSFQYGKGTVTIEGTMQ
ncbi:MAG TPA: serine hydrolase [Puia sp.]|jgi:CubicO group peptidase (beta-lactamase class C family)|nr:serine hydrolase [Puia sp.]